MTKTYIATKAQVDAKVDKETGKSLVLDTEITKLAGVEAGAQVNVLEGVKVNGTAKTITDKVVDITVPVNIKDLTETDEAKYFTATEKSKLSGIAENAQVNVLEGIQFNGTDATITEKKVNITPALIGAAGATHTHGNDDILSGIDAAKITSVNGSKLPLAVIPQGALEVLKIVADDTARMALTIDDVQNGDVVKVTATNKMYFVKDDSKLGTEAAFEEFAAGTAAAVDWANVLNKVNADATHDGLMTSAEYTKLAGIAEGAEANVNADWNETDTTKDSYIQNKPTLGTAAAKDATTSVTSESADLVTSGAVYTEVAKKVTLATGSNSFTLGEDENGLYFE